MSTSTRARASACFVAIVAQAGAASAVLPAAWDVETFTGRIQEIETAGGVLACATDGGLLFYDPVTRTFAPPVADAGCPDRDCLTSNRLTSVSRDGHGQYWLGTAGAGVVVYRPGAVGRQFGQFFALNTAPGGQLLSDSVTCIEAWRTEAVYVGTPLGVGQIDLAGGVESFDPDAVRLLGPHLKGSRINDLAVDSVFVWVATDSGVSRYERRPPYAVQFLPDSLAGGGAFTIEIFDGVPFAGTGVGLFEWQESMRSWKRFGPPSTPNFPVLSVTRLSDRRRFFVGSRIEVWFFTGFVWGRLSPAVIPLIGDRSFPTIVSRGDTVFTSQSNPSGEGGYLNVWYPDPIPGGTWTRQEPSAIPPSEVQALALAPTGELWVGTRIGGVGRRSLDGTWCLYNGNDANVRANMSDAEGHVSALAVGLDGRAWFHALPQTSLSSPVDVLSPDPACDHARDTWSHFRPDDRGFDGRYWKAARDGLGNLFFLSDGVEGGGGPTAGFEIVSGDGALVANVRDDVVGGSSVQAIAFDNLDGPWRVGFVGVNNAGNRGLKIWRLSNDLFTPTSANFTGLILPATMDVSQYRDIVVVPGARRILWVATDNGIFEYDESGGRHLLSVGPRTGAAAGLLSPDVKDLELDDRGNLWIATVRGLNRIVLAGREPGAAVAVEAFTTIETIRELNAGSAFGQLYDPVRALAPLPSAKVNALAYDRQRKLLHLGTEAGVARVRVEELDRQPVLALENVIVWPNPVRIDAGANAVRIARLSEPAAVTIYTLEGEVVCELVQVEDGDVIWDLRAPSCLLGDLKATSGVYLVHVSTSAGTAVRPLVVIR